MDATNQNAEPISRLLHNTLFSQQGEVFNELQPISDLEFTSGLALIATATLIFGLVIRIFGS